MVSAVLLASCVKQAPPDALNESGADPTNVTSIDQTASVADLPVRQDGMQVSEQGAGDNPSVADGSVQDNAWVGGSAQPASYAVSDDAAPKPSEPFDLELIDQIQVDAGSGETRRLNLALPEGKEKVDHLFADSDNGPNYFKSSREKKEKEAVKLKGKLYMIDEPSAEKRIQNVDGGEVGIVVPLR